MNEQAEWRDDPDIIWRDVDGDSIVVRPGSIDGTAWVDKDDHPEVIERLAAAWGFDVTLTPKPTPIVVGDRVRLAYGGGIGVVLHLHDEYAWVEWDDRCPATHRLNFLTRLDPEPEPETCTKDHRLCTGDLSDRCDERIDDGGWVCSRPLGHSGDHIACGYGTGVHNLAREAVES